MKKLAILPVIGLALAGCQSIEHLQATVGNASNFQLCRAIFLAPQNVSNIAVQEAQRRQLDCRPYAGAVFQNEAQANAAMDALARQLLTPPPRSAPTFAPPTTCRTIRLGDTLQTHCF
jgi:hypothetical protein